MLRLTRRIAAAVAPLAFAIGLAAASPAGAQDILVGGYAGSVLPSGSLMAPIAPIGILDTAVPAPTTTGNSALSSTIGNGSLSLIAQTGSGNRAAQFIEGSNTALGLIQGGTNNSVIQASYGDDNRQLIGVSGRNNDVAYVQVGNQLSGVLDVTGAVNTSVLVLQTPQTGRFVMPSGIRGAENKVVIVGPGRIHVINKSALR